MITLSQYQWWLSRVIALAALVLAVAVFTYGALLLGAVAHAAGRTSAERQVRELSVQVSTLESQYLTKNRDISQLRATDLGFVAPTAISTVVVAGDTLTLRN